MSKDAADSRSKLKALASPTVSLAGTISVMVNGKAFALYKADHLFSVEVKGDDVVLIDADGRTVARWDLAWVVNEVV